MDKRRKRRLKQSVVTSLALQITTLVCGLIVPRALLNAFGSEVYGATTSITQFLSYITLLEGGIGGVTRAALYKPLAEKDTYRISVIVYELKRFFRIIAYISMGYAVFLACSFKFLSRIEGLDWITTALLVLVMAISAFGQYFIGISYSALIQADQKVYLINILSIVTTIVNALFVIVLVYAGSGLLFVKLVSSCVFLIKPVAMWLYVRKKYGLISHPERDPSVLSQRWTGLGQHIAFYIHSNTDVAVLTLFDNLKSVSIYSVYYMVTHNIQNVIAALCSGMEPLFGDMIARSEKDSMNATFTLYEMMTSFACSILFSTVYIMIVPFIQIYTKGVNDANYAQPLFAILLTTAAVVFCIRLPYCAAITAAGHFKQTKWGAYGEAIINILVSVVLVWKLGLIGVAIGTIAAIGFRLIYSVVYLAKNIIYRPIAVFIFRTLVNIVCIGAICLVGFFVVRKIEITNYMLWFICAISVFVFASIVTLVVNYIIYPDMTIRLIRTILKRKNTISKSNK